uniref:Fanconi anemia group A protein homolog n=1 Tax=Solea senegalensis TaxID=28829 RepID=UPI001CD81E21|nr:Fanconi anemia group A protein homolog [Solea senegalensis]
MSVNASCQSVCQERTVSSLLAGRVVKRPKLDNGRRLQDAAIQLLQQQQNLSGLLREVETLKPHSRVCVQGAAVSEGVSSAAAASLLVSELRRQAEQLGVPVVALSVTTALQRLKEIIAGGGGGGQRRELLTSSQRVQLCVLLESSKELMSQGVFCPKLLWQEYRADQRQTVSLEVLYHLHSHGLLSLTFILQSDDGVGLWLASRLKALCSWTPPPLEEEEETKHIQRRVLSLLLRVLVGSGFESSSEASSSSLLCRSVLDDALFCEFLFDFRVKALYCIYFTEGSHYIYVLSFFKDVQMDFLSFFSSGVLDTVDKQSDTAGAELWVQLLDASLCGASASPEALQRCFTHSLTQTLTYKPRLTVSDAVRLQNQWTFAKASRLLTLLFRKLSVIFSAELLLRHLQRVLETHEVNWKHVLCFLSTLLVYNPDAESNLRELLTSLLTSAFEGYDLEHMVTAFLLARQGALEGMAIFSSSYTDWFKMSFGGSSGLHAASKKSLVFLLKFLSDLVPFEPPQYLKVHILHPPFIPTKHRSLLMEYVSLAKTRLTDLKESVENMGLYEDVSGAGGTSAQDVEKAVSLFESTGRISTTVMEASIFRRPYFLTRFLPALLTPRVLPVKPDARMSLIQALRKTDKIPAAQYSSYVESCHKHTRQDERAVCLDAGDDPVEVLRLQLHGFRELLDVEGNDGEMTAQLSRVSDTLSVIFPGRADDVTEPTVIRVHVDSPLSPELHVTVVNMILRHFCQCLLDASRTNPPNKQNQWASRFVAVLLGNTQLLSGLIHRLWDLFHNQGSSLSSAHLLGLGAFVVHLHASMTHSHLILLAPPHLPELAPVAEAVCSALVCSTHSDMLFCVRLCVAAVCYGICVEQYLVFCVFRQNQWASRFVAVLLGNTQLLSGLIHRLWDLFHNQGSSLSSAHLLGLGAFVVHLHASMTHSHLILLAPPHLPELAPVAEAVCSALVCSTHSDMLFCVRLCVAAVCYGICRGESMPPQQREVYVLSGFYKKLLYLIPRLLPEARRTTPVAAEENLTGLWSGSTWRRTAWRLWTHAAFHQLHNSPRYQLLLSEWLNHELRVQRSQDVLSDPERQEYQQWACLELYWPRPEEQGGCGGDVKVLCSRLLDAVMDQSSGDVTVEMLHHRSQTARGTCLPDIMSRLQEVVCEMEVTDHVCDFLFEFVSQRCCSPADSPLSMWNRVLLALPPLLFIKVRDEGGRKTLDCTTLIQHINQHQRTTCSPAGSLSFHLTAHFLRGVLRASACCESPTEEVNKAWCQISVQCPLLLTSTVLWWECLSLQLSSLWSRVCDEDSLPQQLQLITDCHSWANSVVSSSSASATPAAPALMLASSLHRSCQRPGHNFSAALNLLRPERSAQHRQVLVFLLFLCVNEYLSAVLCSQETNVDKCLRLCSRLVSVLVDTPDWLLLFKSSAEQGVYQSVTMVTTDQVTRLMPWAFYSVLQQQSSELQLKAAVKCPGFLQTSVLCYVSLLQLFLDGHTLTARSRDQQILSRAKSSLLTVISLSPPAALSSGQLRHLESQCSDLDPEVAAALSAHLSVPSLSPEMDFL